MVAAAFPQLLICCFLKFTRFECLEILSFLSFSAPRRRSVVGKTTSYRVDDQVVEFESR
jgi:hypothetical protein